MEHDYIRLLVENAQSGRKNSFVDLCEMNVKQIYNFVLFILPDRVIAKELTTEIFLAAWENIKFVREDTPFFLWLKGIAVFASLDEFRTGKRSQALIKKEENLNYILESENELVNKIVSLPETDRVIFTLNRVGDYSVREIHDFFTDLTQKEIEEKIINTICTLVDTSSDNLPEDIRQSLCNTDSSNSKYDSTTSPLPDSTYKIIKLQEAIEKLQFHFVPPEEIISEVRDELLRESEQIAKKKGKETQKEKLLRKIRIQKRKELSQKIRGEQSLTQSSRISINFLDYKLALPFATLVMVILIFYIVHLAGNTAPWKLSPLAGSFKVNGFQSNEFLLDEDDILETGLEGKVHLEIPSIAVIEIFPESKILLETAHSSANTLILSKGGLSFSNISLGTNFNVRFNGITIRDRNSNFIVKTDSARNLIISVEKGLSEIVSEKRSLFLSSGYFCFIKDGHDIGTPVHYQASNVLKEKLYKYNNEDQSYEALTKILFEAKYSDALTLFDLFNIVSPSRREMIFNKLIYFFPLPKSITKEEVLRLEKEALFVWWDSIQWQL